MKLKPIEEQVVVLVGASSGIGRAAALKFAQRGARVVVAARGAEGLQSLVEEIRASGGEAVSYTCDVLHYGAIKALADSAADVYGRVDTWVHLAAVSLYATFEQTEPEEFKQVIDTNLTGQAYGAMAALPHLRRAGGGALIHVSSVEARRALPLQSAYAASKHGMKGFIEALRVELLHEGAPISVTEIMPASINTPFFDKARTKMGVKPQGIPPIYQPDTVAEAILYAAENPVPEIIVGGAGKAFIVGEKFAPRLLDTVLARVGFEGQRTDEPRGEDAPDNLFHTLDRDDPVEGDFTGRALKTSAYTWLTTHPGVKYALTLGAVGVLAALATRARSGGQDNGRSQRAKVGDKSGKRREAGARDATRLRLRRS
ncbi:MAG TPA: SDR family oxidoreductase [Pyrinomonadaceae bacterium]|nr:SDR family oxidoreductase [Pyrinomonadaceae bacterium]